MAGDANYDGGANNLDLLPIGIGYGSTVIVRPEQVAGTAALIGMIHLLQM
jgi:hypothetical protein